jgi:hypothetical protein
MTPTLTPEREKEIKQLCDRMFDQKVREAGIPEKAVIDSLPLRQQGQLGQIIGDVAHYNDQLRESATRTLLNAALASDGIPMRDGVRAAPAFAPDPLELSVDEMHAAMIEDGIPMSDAGVLRPRRGDGLTMTPMREAKQKPDDDPVLLGMQEMTRRAAVRKQEEAEADRARDASPIPIREGGDPSAAIEAAQFFTDDSPVIGEDGLIDLGPGVPTSRARTPRTAEEILAKAQEEEAQDEARLGAAA